MSRVDALGSPELTVARDGSIPADQIARLGLRPGARLKVVTESPRDQRERFGGSLPDLPDVTWEDFERGSELALGDLRSS